MSSLVRKWQAIKQQEASISEEESEEEDFTTRTEAQIQQWRQEQIERFFTLFSSYSSVLYLENNRKIQKLLDFFFSISAIII